jgi:thiamine monophosphate kinase
VVRVDEETGRGVAISTDCNSRFAKLDPYAGAQLALAEAYRNVATAGAVPLAVTDCLNFGSPEDPGVMWQFAEAIRGLSDGCRQLGIPVTGGNVSFYNQTGDVAIHPTPVVGVLGVMDDVARRTPSGWKAPGQVIYLLGTTADELGGSEWANVEHQHLGGLPPAVDLDRERQLGQILVNASRDGLVDAAHDLSDGGLAVALAEASLRHGVGARIWTPSASVTGSTRSRPCSASRPAGRSWRCPARRRCGSPTCARPAASPTPASASSTRSGRRSTSRGCSPCRWPSCAPPTPPRSRRPSVTDQTPTGRTAQPEFGHEESGFGRCGASGRRWRRGDGGAAG